MGSLLIHFCERPRPSSSNFYVRIQGFFFFFFFLLAGNLGDSFPLGPCREDEGAGP